MKTERTLKKVAAIQRPYLRPDQNEAIYQNIKKPDIHLESSENIAVNSPFDPTKRSNFPRLRKKPLWETLSFCFKRS